MELFQTPFSLSTLELMSSPCLHESEVMVQHHLQAGLCPWWLQEVKCKTLRTTSPLFPTLSKIVNSSWEKKKKKKGVQEGIQFRCERIHILTFLDQARNTSSIISARVPVTYPKKKKAILRLRTQKYQYSCQSTQNLRITEHQYPGCLCNLSWFSFEWIPPN